MTLIPNLRVPRLLLLAPLALLFAACSSDNDNGGGGDTDPPPAGGGFRDQPVEWTFTMPDGGGELCFDIDAGEEAVCDDGTDWDLKLTSGGRTVSFWTNSGVSGVGNGGAFGLFEWTELLGWLNATHDPATGQDISGLYFIDGASSVFTASSWYAYNLQGTHQLHPNYRVYLIHAEPGNAEAPQFALQVTGYYGGSGGTTSGHPRIRWIDRADVADVREQTINATSHSAWVYVDLATGETLDLSDQDAAESTAWHIAFRRSEIKLNGGESGPGDAAGFLARTPEGFYDGDGEPITAKFLGTTPADTLADLTEGPLNEPANARQWVVDSTTSVLNPPYTGSYPQPLDYGWFIYTPTNHMLTANPDNGALLRSASGNSYARFRVTDIEYADPADYNSAMTWSLEFHIQPAGE